MTSTKSEHGEDKLMQSLVYDPKKPSFLGDERKIHSELAKLGKHIDKKAIIKFLLGEPYFSEWRRRPNRIVRRPLVTKGVFECISSDLLDFSKFSTFNNGLSWACIVVDNASKYLFCRPIKQKNKECMIKVFNEILDEIENFGFPKTKYCFTDLGQEYRLLETTVFSQRNIIRYSTKNKVLKSFLAEKYVQLCAQKLYRAMAFYSTLKWTQYVKDIEAAINDSVPRGSKYTPNEIVHDKKKANIMERNNALKLKKRYEKIDAIEKQRSKKEANEILVGDKVKVLRDEQTPFEKKTYIAQYGSPGVVEKIIYSTPKTYQVSSFPSTKHFLREQLTKTSEGLDQKGSKPSFILVGRRAKPGTGRSTRSGVKTNQETEYLVQAIYDEKTKKYISEADYDTLKKKNLLLEDLDDDKKDD